MLECVANISEGTSKHLIAQICSQAGDALLDVHSDPNYNRSVLTLAGPDAQEAARAIVKAAVGLLDIKSHRGIHPRLGVVDVIPFVPLSFTARGQAMNAPVDKALRARNAFASWAANDLQLPCFLYGPGRDLPEIRRRAFVSLAPDAGPHVPHRSAGAACVGARRILVAYNISLAEGGVDLAREIARNLRGLFVRSLALCVDGTAQVSCNLLEPVFMGPMQVFDFIARQAQIKQAELVGLIPSRALDAIPKHRWKELDVADDRTIEARLELLGSVTTPIS